jgi:hypothetical protein
MIPLSALTNMKGIFAVIALSVICVEKIRMLKSCLARYVFSILT